ncbi:MAG: hypothetical protein RI996_177 [Candidatus Parcubacteria bacterium]|jgi:hypothetical protein
MNEEIKKQLIEKLGLQDLDEPEQGAVFADIGELIFSQIVLDSYDALPTEKQALFKELSEKENTESLVELLSSSLTDYENIVKNASEKVLADLV